MLLAGAASAVKMHSSASRFPTQHAKWDEMKVAGSSQVQHPEPLTFALGGGQEPEKTTKVHKSMQESTDLLAVFSLRLHGTGCAHRRSQGEKEQLLYNAPISP